MNVDVDRARAIASRTTGRRRIGHDEITTAGLAELADVAPSTVRRWARQPGFPPCRRLGVYPLRDVVNWLNRWIPASDDQLDADDAITLYRFARLRGLADFEIYQYVARPGTVFPAPVAYKHNGTPQYRLGDLDTFWSQGRKGQGRGPRPTRRGVPHPGRPPNPHLEEAVRLVRAAQTSGEKVTGRRLAEHLGVPPHTGQRLLRRARQELESGSGDPSNP